MKKLLTIALLLCITTIANSQIIRAELTATGLTCSMCSKATYNQLISIPEVEKVEPDLNNTTFIIHFKSNTPVTISNLKKKVEDAGFAVGELIVLFKLDNQVAENNTSFVIDPGFAVQQSLKMVKSKTNAPLLMLIDTKDQIKFISAGYAIGNIDLMIQSMQAERLCLKNCTK
jgi:copper chaperone CopZ